nr:MAG TPA: hypothetical protein [Caudoviricetes sp.]
MRILDNPVGLISIHTERVRSGKLKILICEIVLVQTLKIRNSYIILMM